jgi:tRNA (guanine-N7-)-methyltransferase
MSKRNKLLKFADLLSFPHVYENFDPKRPMLLGQNGEEVDLKGKWSQLHFHNAQPITLELACGKGHYTLGLAMRYPNRNFIGVDIKGARIWRGAKTALENELKNVAFLRTRIEQIQYFFEPNEVHEIWITFPDPFLSNTNANRRLTSAYFLELYQQLLVPKGLVHLKTDSSELYEFTLRTLQEVSTFKISYQNDDIYTQPLLMEELSITTEYEQIHLKAGKSIKYVQLQSTK